MRILIAEDDSMSRSMLKMELTALGHEVIACKDGREAWETFDRDPLRLVISDWKMPEYDGLELCRKIRARPQTPYTYFALLTAIYTQLQHNVRAVEAGVDDFLLKPFNRESLWMSLRVAERVLEYTSEIRHLKQLLAACPYCRKIKNDEDQWQDVDVYLYEQTGTNFTHLICPTCHKEHILPMLERMEGPK